LCSRVEAQGRFDLGAEDVETAATEECCRRPGVGADGVLGPHRARLSREHRSSEKVVAKKDPVDPLIVQTRELIDRLVAIEAEAK